MICLIAFLAKIDTSADFIFHNYKFLFVIDVLEYQPFVWYYQRCWFTHGGEIEGAGVEPRRRGVLEWKGVQSISRKSVCTARSPNAATLSSYSFDRDPLSLCTQSLMALFKDRNRSMSRPRARPRRRGMNVQIRLKITFLPVVMRQCAIRYLTRKKTRTHGEQNLAHRIFKNSTFKYYEVFKIPYIKV